MRKILTATMAALALGGGALATAVPAQARDWHEGGGWHGDHDGGAGPAIFAGVAGLALGAALADSHPHYYHRGYDRSYYDYDDDAYGYQPYRVCYARTRVWDPYAGGYVIERTRYAC